MGICGRRFWKRVIDYDPSGLGKANVLACTVIWEGKVEIEFQIRDPIGVPQACHISAGVG